MGGPVRAKVNGAGPSGNTDSVQLSDTAQRAASGGLAPSGQTGVTSGSRIDLFA
jgi:hypothetical protein